MPFVINLFMIEEKRDINEFRVDMKFEKVIGICSVSLGLAIMTKVA